MRKRRTTGQGARLKPRWNRLALGRFSKAAYTFSSHLLPSLCHRFIKSHLEGNPMDSEQKNSRREMLKASAALAAGGITMGGVGKAQAQHDGHAATPGSENAYPMIHGSKEQIEYGHRSKYVTSVRVQHPIGGRPSPDVFGKVFHVATPLQDSVGVITPSSLHYIATTRGSFLPDIDPKQHTLTIHGEVDRPLTLTMDDLRRFPSVTRLHFIECAGNRHNGK